MTASKDLTSEVWDEWLNHPATKLVRERARGKREELKELWAEGNFTASFDIEMMAKNAAATGAASVYLEFQELEFDLFMEGSNDEK